MINVHNTIDKSKIKHKIYEFDVIKRSERIPLSQSPEAYKLFQSRVIFHKIRNAIQSHWMISLWFRTFIDQFQIICDIFVYCRNHQQTASHWKEYRTRKQQKTISNCDELKCYSNQIAQWIFPIEWIPEKILEFCTWNKKKRFVHFWFLPESKLHFKRTIPCICCKINDITDDCSQ